MAARTRDRRILSKSKPATMRRASLLAALIVVSALGLATSSIGDSIETLIDRRALFSARNGLGFGPGIDARLRLIAFDDGTEAEYGRKDLAAMDFLRIAEMLAEAKVSKIFVSTAIAPPETAADEREFRRRMRKLGSTTEIIVPSYMGAPGSGLMPPTDVSFLRRAMRRWLDLRIDGTGERREDLVPFGPRPMWRRLAKFGQMNIREGRIAPLWPLGDTAIANQNVLAARSVSLLGGRLTIDGRHVPLREGWTLVDVDAPSSYWARTISMRWALAMMEENQALHFKNPVDTVLIGDIRTYVTTYVETAIGSTIAAHVNLAILDMVQRGHWLRELDVAPWLVAAAGVAAAAFVLLLRRRAALLLMTLLVLALTAGPLAAFILGGIVTPWTLALATGLVTFVTCLLVRTQAEAIEQAVMAKELETASVIQGALLPGAAVDLEGVTLASLYRPASSCGGDLWGYFTPRDGLVYVFIGDATGHRAAAAMVASLAFATFSNAFDEAARRGEPPPSPAALLSRINAVCTRAAHQLATMTLLVVALDLPASRATFSNAAHPFPLLMRRGVAARPRRLANGGPLLGLDGHETFTDVEVPFEPGDRLVLYTDGLVENVDRRGKVLTKSLARDLRAAALLDAHAIVRQLSAAVQAHEDGVDAADDVTVVVVERPSEGATALDADVAPRAA